jgi:hypothetical protein
MADAMAGVAANDVATAPPKARDAAVAGAAAAFRDACDEHGVPIEIGDIVYYLKVVAAKAAEMIRASDIAASVTEKPN